MEEWKGVVGWPDHEVSSLGRVRRLESVALLPGHELRQYETEQGYRSIHLAAAVHRLVAEAFVGPCPSGFVANHKNGDKTDNRAENLEWVSRSENQDHALRTGLSMARGETHGQAVLTDEQVREIRREYKGGWGEQTRMAKQYGVSQAIVSQIVRGEVWMHLDPGYEPKRCLNKKAFGEGSGRAKLTDDAVREIRRRFALGEGQQRLALEFGVRFQAIRDIIRGRRWKHVQ